VTIKQIPTLSLLKSFEVLRIPNEVYQDTVDWYLSDDVDQAWSGEDSNHFEVAYIQENRTEMPVGLPREDHRECMDDRSAEV